MTEKIIECIKENPLLSSKEIHEKLPDELGYATLKRTLSKLVKEKLISTIGKSRATKYKISPAYQLFYPK